MSEQDGKAQAQAEKALEVLDQAIESGAPGEAIFRNPDVLKLFGLVRLNDPATYGLIRQRLKWKVNLQDLDRSVKAAVGGDPEQSHANADQRVERNGS
jgi:hypothetical protein